ncbi:hypothetical protein PV326_012512 [Microctonus aethiopoides]|nr:hypothetical protein PV326_012512 [Microctonus aethiopoides]
MYIRSFFHLNDLQNIESILIIIIMESWLSDVQRVKIPRPKFGSGNSVRRSNSTAQHCIIRVDAHHARQAQDVAKATEELRQAIQDKL